MISNSCIFIGRFTADPEERLTTNGTKYTKFTIAVQRTKDKADFIPCTAWTDVAEKICKYFKKGKPIMVRGSMETDSKETDSGERRYFFEINVREWQFAPFGSAQEQKEEEPQEAPPTQEKPSESPGNTPNTDPGDGIPDDPTQVGDLLDGINVPETQMPDFEAADSEDVPF
jgi:single-strand DNA-binding protein